MRVTHVFLRLPGALTPRAHPALSAATSVADSPVDPFQHVGNLRGRNRHHAVRRRRPGEVPVLEPLVTRPRKQTIPSLRRSLSA